MIKIDGNKIWHDGKEIGFIDGHKIRTADWKTLGYFDEKHVYDPEGKKLASMGDDELYAESGDVAVSLKKIEQKVEGMAEHPMAKCAIYTFFVE